MSKVKEDKKYVHAKVFKEKFGIPEASMKTYANNGIIRCKKMRFGVRLYHIDDGPMLIKLRELKNIKFLNKSEKRLISSLTLNLPKKIRICYSRVKDETESEILECEKKLFQKYIENIEIIQEYAEIDNISRPLFFNILERCEREEVREIYVTSKEVIASKTFPIIEAILQAKHVDLYSLDKDGVFKNILDPDDDYCTNEIIRNHKERYENEYLNNKSK